MFSMPCTNRRGQPEVVSTNIGGEKGFESWADGYSGEGDSPIHIGGTVGNGGKSRIEKVFYDDRI